MGLEIQRPTTIEGTLRQLQLVHACLIVSILLYVFLMKLLQLPNTESPSTNLVWGLAIESVVTLGVGFSIRSRKLSAAFQTLRVNPNDPGALAQWRTGAIISDALAESVALCGFVIHYLGGTSRQAAPFFAAGFLAMLLWWPRRP